MLVLALIAGLLVGSAASSLFWFRLNTAQRELSRRRAKQIRILRNGREELQQLLWNSQHSVSQLREENHQDAVTGTSNRKAFDQRLVEELSRAVRHGTNLGLLFIDLNKFKQINDSFGHDEGDRVLGEVGMALEEGSRISELVSRYGGDEFAVILVGTDIDSAFYAAERYQKLIASVVTPDGSHLSAAIGVATVRQLDEISVSALVRAADQAMYLAKEAGDGTIRLWGHTMGGESVS